MHIQPHLKHFFLINFFKKRKNIKNIQSKCLSCHKKRKNKKIKLQMDKDETFIQQTSVLVLLHLSQLQFIF